MVVQFKYITDEMAIQWCVPFGQDCFVMEVNAPKWVEGIFVTCC